MHRRLLIVLAAVTAAFALPGIARAGQCGLPDGTPLWIDQADGTVGFRQLFARPGTVVATVGGAIPAALRAAGAQTIYWQMSLAKLVGTPAAPADPATIVPAADGLAGAAAVSSGCQTPLIALNELLGTAARTPWDEGTTAYRANVLALLQELAARGARPFLLLPSGPPPDLAQSQWWQQVAQSADVVREVYFKAPQIVGEGPLVGSRALRTRMRAAVQGLTALGVPVSRIGLMLGFQSGGTFGRDGIQPREAWLEFVKLDVLAAKQVASELGVATLWNWGWGTYSAGGADPDKAAAACVALWTRDQTLCDGPTAGGPAFDASLTEGQIDPSLWCSFGDVGVTPAQLALAERVEGGDEARAGTLLLERAAQAAVPVTRGQVLDAERTIVRERFKGKRSLYVRTLNRVHLTVGLARGIIVDELRGLPSPEAQQALLDQATCAGDELPAVGTLRAANRFPFLKLDRLPSGGSGP